jgi:hypothetical protein
LVAVSATVYVPAAVYVCDGFCVVEVPPSPNAHEYDEAPLELLVKLTVNGTSPEVGLPEKLAVGTVLTVMYPVLVSVSLPAELVAVNETV